MEDPDERLTRALADRAEAAARRRRLASAEKLAALASERERLLTG